MLFLLLVGGRIIMVCKIELIPPVRDSDIIHQTPTTNHKLQYCQGESVVHTRTSHMLPFNAIAILSLTGTNPCISASQSAGIALNALSESSSSEPRISAPSV